MINTVLIKRQIIRQTSIFLLKFFPYIYTRRMISLDRWTIFGIIQASLLYVMEFF